jgi:hypothetical protein
MAWTRPKDVNYYGRLAMVSKIRRYVDSKMDFGVPLIFNPPIPYSYNGGRKLIINIERYQYMSVFKREFKTIRCELDDGRYVRLADLRMKHLVEIYKQLPK